MQVGEQRVVGAQAGTFDGLRLLDLDDQLGDIEDPVRARHDRRPPGGVVLVAEPGARAGVVLDEDFVAPGAQLLHAVRSQTDAPFLVLDLLRDTDAHDHLLYPVSNNDSAL